jgi:hypothetical protein
LDGVIGAAVINDQPFDLVEAWNLAWQCRKRNP